MPRPATPARHRPAAPPPAARAARRDSRLAAVLDAAAAQFAARGYEAASIRDIVQQVGMLPGSLYCHFANKEALLAAVYAEGVRRIGAAVDAAAARHDEPWARLEAACVAHLQALLDRGAYAQVVTRVGPASVPALAAELVELRDDYERRFAALVGALPLPPGTPRATLRLLLLGALNWTPTWFREGGGLTPATLARRYVRLLADVQRPAPAAAAATVAAAAPPRRRRAAAQRGPAVSKR
jgi:AcrR family transcriptional regulator